MLVKQFVMAYEVEQDRLRACIPAGFHSLRPVLRINAEIRGTQPETAYLEFNTAVEGYGKRGWLNIGHWDSAGSDLSYYCAEDSTVFSLPELTISFTSVGIQGGCPAEKDNQGCFYLGSAAVLRLPEAIAANKEFCNCDFAWSLPHGGAHGISSGKTLPAYATPPQKQYPPCPFCLKSAASIPCKQVLGAYRVTFEREAKAIEKAELNGNC